MPTKEREARIPSRHARSLRPIELKLKQRALAFIFQIDRAGWALTAAPPNPTVIPLIRSRENIPQTFYFAKRHDEQFVSVISCRVIQKRIVVKCERVSSFEEETLLATNGNSVFINTCLLVNDSFFRVHNAFFLTGEGSDKVRRFTRQKWVSFVKNNNHNIQGQYIHIYLCSHIHVHLCTRIHIYLSSHIHIYLYSLMQACCKMIIKTRRRWCSLSYLGASSDKVARATGLGSL